MGLKEKYIYKNLCKKVASFRRIPELPDLDAIKRVGVIWQPSQKKAFLYLQAYFKKPGVIFRDLCVFESKVESDPNVDMLHAKDLNWWGIPKAGKTDAFMNMDFDLLLNIATEQNLLLDYISGLTHARFKTGWSSNPMNFFDMNINISKNPDSLYLAKQQIFYLGELNKKTSK